MYDELGYIYLNSLSLVEDWQARHYIKPGKNAIKHWKQSDELMGLVMNTVGSSNKVNVLSLARSCPWTKNVEKIVLEKSSKYCLPVHNSAARQAVHKKITSRRCD